MDREPIATPRTVAAIAVGCLFLVTAIGKLVDPSSVHATIEVLLVQIADPRHVPISTASIALTASIVAVEVAIGGALVACRARPRWAGTSAIGILILFSIVLAWMTTMDSPPSCGCLGAWEILRGNAHMSASAGLIRNLGLCLLLGWIIGKPGTLRPGIRSPTPTTSRTAFTLIETLVVIAVLAVVLAIALPALRGARNAGKDVDTLSQTRQSIAAIEMYTRSESDYLPYLGVPGDPERGTLAEVPWEHRPPTYFRGQSLYWPTALLAQGLDLSALRKFSIERRPRRDLVQTFLFLTHAAQARPEYWIGEEPPDDDRLYAGVRIDEVVFPSSKGLLLDVDPVLPDHSDVPLGRIVGFFDGSASTKSLTSPDAFVQGLDRPYAAIPWRVLTTSGGVRGLDY